MATATVISVCALPMESHFSCPKEHAISDIN